MQISRLFDMAVKRLCVCFVFDRSLYREFLFLTLAAMGKDHVGKKDAPGANTTGGYRLV